MSLTGCSLVGELAAPAANFALGLYNADTYYSKECAWYEPVWFSKETKEWIKKAKPDPVALKDFAKVARNNDIFKEVCDDRDS
tara:strand:+ start:1232 stop:1480 length:249 start_codon:yes stop_codon:yes gene_type:complete